MPRHRDSAKEDIRLDPRLQTRLEEKKAMLDLHRPSENFLDKAATIRYNANADTTVAATSLVRLVA